MSDAASKTGSRGLAPERVVIDGPSSAGRREAFEAFFGLLRTCSQLGGEAERLATRLLDEFDGDGRRFVAHLAVQERLFSYPSEKFLNACAAVLAWNLDLGEIDIRHSHGWPILSLRPRTATIAGEGAGASSVLFGNLEGAAAA